MKSIFKSLPRSFWASEESEYEILVVPAKTLQSDFGTTYQKLFKTKGSILEIHISDECPEHLIRRTLVHEMIHAFDIEHFGDSFSEKQVRLLEEKIYQIAILNNWIPRD